MKLLLVSTLLAQFGQLTPFGPPRVEPVRVSGGLVQGVPSPDGYVAYNGIPYATVTNRFQDASPNVTWAGILYAYNTEIKCSQSTSLKRDVDSEPGREDCLTINVYTPAQPSGMKTSTKTVMVFIHGGAFKRGSASPSIYGPQFFLKQDIVLVSFNYRLGALGFLCLGIKEAPGNVGLKDQVLALRWVQKNIEAFGGDPDKVTIFGESAGAASTAYHLLSPMSKNLFARAIMQSGSALAPWALQFEPIDTAASLAAQLGKNTTGVQELYNFLKNRSAEELVVDIPRTSRGTVLSENIFTPCLEKKYPGVERFLPDVPLNLLSAGNYNKVPVIAGYNSEEGYLFASWERQLSTIDIEHSLPPNLHFDTRAEKLEAGKIIKSLYFPPFVSQISKKTIVELSKYEGEMGFIFPSSWMIERLLKSSDQPVFAYKFMHDGLLNFAKLSSDFRFRRGATHGDDIFYLFKSKVTNIVTPKDRDMINKMTTMWTNFAKFSDPTPMESSLLPVKWQAATEEDPKVLILDNEFSYTKLYEDSERLNFWRSLYQKNWRRS